MRINYVAQGRSDILQIDDAKIIFKNFSGEPSQYNREGDRNFALLIDDEDVANELVERGWNVKIKPPREEGEMPFMYLPVKVKFNDYGPTIYLKTGDKLNTLNEGSVGMLDGIDILSIGLDIRGHDWEVNGNTGRSAYLQLMHVEQRVDRFAAMYNFDSVDDEEIF